MTTLLDHAVRTARRLSPAMQDDLAQVMLSFSGEDLPVVTLSPDEDESLARSEAEAQRGDFASDAEVRAVWAKHGL